MSLLIDVLKVVHIINAILMAWPFYALVAVNQRYVRGKHHQESNRSLFCVSSHRTYHGPYGSM